MSKIVRVLLDLTVWDEADPHDVAAAVFEVVCAELGCSDAIESFGSGPIVVKASPTR